MGPKVTKPKKSNEYQTNQFSGQIWKMEGTNLINKAGTFNSDDAWNLIPLIQEKSKIVKLSSKFGFAFFQFSVTQVVSPKSS